VAVTVGIMGAGSAAKDFLSILPADVTVAGLGDNSRHSHGEMDGHSAMPVADLVARNPDYIVICARAVDELRAQVESLGFPREKVFAYYPSYSENLADRVNSDIAALNDNLGLAIPFAGVATMYVWPSRLGAQKREDFVRRQSFRLAAERIRDQGIPGAVAELGVYQGEQAALLNDLFPGRRMRLFDTFEGFSDKDLPAEAEFSGAAVGDFANTSIDLVMSQMSDPSMVSIHQGFFPESAAGIDDQFAFVSLDVDLHDPTAAGLRWFYPRLSKGGYIFVHDYNNRRYMGVRRAVDEFVNESGACAVPLPDFAGSIVIAK
jgi:O-methyltransferase